MADTLISLAALIVTVVIVVVGYARTQGLIEGHLKAIDERDTLTLAARQEENKRRDRICEEHGRIMDNHSRLIAELREGQVEVKGEISLLNHRIESQENSMRVCFDRVDKIKITAEGRK